MMTEKKYLIEIATADLETTRQAVQGGADRIELCANLGEGGTTPAYGTLRRCRELFEVPIFPIIRSRSGDFLYGDDEYHSMQYDIEIVKSLGFEGVVIGMLLVNGQIDLSRTAALRELAYPMEVTFHRAFDRCSDPVKALEELISIGIDRVLTSGQALTAPEGVECIAALQSQANGRIVVMPGSGVRPDNLSELKDKTGCYEFHTSLRGWKESKMQFRHPNFKQSVESYRNPNIEAEQVRRMKGD